MTSNLDNGFKTCGVQRFPSSPQFDNLVSSPVLHVLGTVVLRMINYAANFPTLLAYNFHTTTQQPCLPPRPLENDAESLPAP